MKLPSWLARLIWTNSLNGLDKEKSAKIYNENPIYMTLGNIPRAIKCKPTQQVCFLLGYLLVDKILKDDLTSREVSSRDQRISMIYCASF